MNHWNLLAMLLLLMAGCESTSSSTGSSQKNGGGEKIEEAYHVKVAFIAYQAEEKLYQLKVTDIISLPAAPPEVLAVNDVVKARDADEGNQLRNKVLTQAPNEPFEVWMVGRPAMGGTDWIIKKYNIE